MALYLHCVICSRKQADGLVSGFAWARLELPADAQVEHPAVRGSSARACPTCVGQYTDWQGRAMSTLGIAGYEQSMPATA